MSSHKSSRCPRQKSWRLVMAGFALCFSVCLSPILGQPPLQQLLPKNADAIPEGLQPDAIYYEDENGEWVQLLPDRAREFEAFLRARNAGLALNRSAPKLEGLTLDVRLDGKLARLLGKLTANLEADTDKWFEIPVDLTNVQVLPVDQKVYSRIVPAVGSGYLWRHGPSKAGPIQLEFQAVLNITPSTEGGSIRLDLPNTHTDIKLPLAPSDWEVSVTGSGKEVIIPNHQERTYLVQLSGGAVGLSWSRKAATDIAQTTEALSTLRISIDSIQNEFNVSCRLNIRSPRRLGGRSFSITLPPNSSWRNRTSTTTLLPGYRLAPSPDRPTEQLNLEIDESVVQSDFEVNLDWSGKLESDSQTLRIALPRIEGVRTHSGQLNFSLNRSQSLLWEPQNGIFYVRGANADSTDSQSPSFRIDHDNNAWTGRLVHERSVPSIRADYRLWLSTDRITMTSVIEFKEDLRGLPFLQWESRGWDISSAVVLSTGKQLITNAFKPVKDFMLPLTVADLSDGSESQSNLTSNIETPLGKRLWIQCTIPLNSLHTNIDSSNPSTDLLSIPLPSVSWLNESQQARQTWSPPGSIRLESNVSRFKPATDMETGIFTIHSSGIPLETMLNDARVQPVTALPSRSTLTLANRGASAPQTIQVNHWPLGPDIEANETIRITQGRDIKSIEQDWLLRTQGVFPATLYLAIPNSWGNINLSSDEVTIPFELTLTGTPLSHFSKINEAVHAKLSSRYPKLGNTHTWLNVEIPEAVRSQIVEETQSLLSVVPRNRNETATKDSSSWLEHSFAFLEAGEPRSWIRRQSNVCLVLSEPNTKLLVNDFVLSQSASEIRIGNDLWRQTRIDMPNDAFQLTANLIPASGSEIQDIAVERIWIQSLIQPRELRHRVVIRLHTNLSTISLQLPPGFEKEMELTVNGAKGTWIESTDKRGTGLIDLSRVSELELINPISSENRAAQSKTYVVELFSWQAFEGIFWRNLSMPRIQIQNLQSSKAPVLWQILTSPSDQLFASSESLAPQNTWTWSHLWFERQDSRLQEHFEREIGASVQPILEMPLKQNSIVAIDSTQVRWVRLVPRQWIWLPVGLLTFVASISIYYVRSLRSPIWLIAYLIAAIGLFQYWLDGAVVFIQTALLAAVVSTMAILVAWVLDRNSRRRTILAGRGATVGSLAPLRTPKAESKPDSKLNNPSQESINSLPTTITPQNDLISSNGGSILLEEGRDGLASSSSVQGTTR